MGIALLTFSNFLAPLQALVNGWMPRPSQPVPRPRTARAGVAGSRGCAWPAAPLAVPARRLRVVRVLEPQAPRACAGRMVISGSMADVCAELDRLAALESLQSAH